MLCNPMGSKISEKYQKYLSMQNDLLIAITITKHLRNKVMEKMQKQDFNLIEFKV